MTTLRALLRQNPNYRYTWMAQVVSEIGDYFNNIAVFALVMEKSGSGLVVTGVMLARAIPAVLAGPVAGVLLDRLDRKQIMIASDLARALIALGFVFTIHQPRPWLLYVLSAGLMFASPFFTAGRAAILPTIATPGRVARRQLADADHAMGHAHGGHAAGRIQRGLAGVSLGVRAQFALLSVLGVGHLADRRARRLPRQTRGRRPRPRARGTSTARAFRTCAASR